MTTDARIRALVTGAAALTLALAGAPPAAAASPGATTLAGLGGYMAFSADGGTLAFLSKDPGTTGDGSGITWLMARDMATGVFERLEVARQAGDGSGTYWLGRPSVSGDGRYVAFGKDVIPGVPGLGDVQYRVVLHDRATGTAEEVSVSSEGAQANGNSLLPSLSADGRLVAFESRATNLAPGDTNGASDVFVHDRATGVTQRVSVAAGGVQTNGGSSHACLSADGRFVAFESTATNLVADDRNGKQDIFVHDRATGTTELISGPGYGTLTREALLLLFGGSNPEHGDAYWPSISADGRFVAFSTAAWNLVANDVNGAGPDVYVRDRATGVLERVSVTSEGRNDDGGWSDLPAISADGRFVAFLSTANRLVPEDTSAYDIYVFDRQAKTIELTSQFPSGDGHDASLSGPAISGDGRFVASAGLLPNISVEPVAELRVRNRGPALGIGGLAASAASGQVAVSGWARIPGDVVTQDTDPVGDVRPGVGDLGGDLARASLVLRPERGDLLVRIHPTKLFRETNPPALIYGLDFRVGGVRYDLRAMRVYLTGGQFDLHRCAPNCVKVATLIGSVGAPGEEVRVAVPLSTLGAQPGATVGSPLAYTALGESATGGLSVLDELGLPATTLLQATLSLGIAPAGTPAEEVSYGTTLAFADTSFSGSLDPGGLAPGTYDVWARACLGPACGARSVEITLGP